MRFDQPDIKGRVYNVTIPIIRYFLGKRTVALLVAWMLLFVETSHGTMPLYSLSLKIPNVTEKIKG